MKHSRFSSISMLSCGLALCGLTTQFAVAQPAPAKLRAAKAAPKTPVTKTPTAPKKRLKNFTLRMVTATEAQTGKTMTPELKEQLTSALRAREAAIQAANDAYYADFAAATGLTPEQAKEIDKPSRAKAPTEAKVEGKTNMDALTNDDDDIEGTPTTPTK